jgi:hypothetical protein
MIIATGGVADVIWLSSSFEVRKRHSIKERGSETNKNSVFHAVLTLKIEQNLQIPRYFPFLNSPQVELLSVVSTGECKWLKVRFRKL